MSKNGLPIKSGERGVALVVSLVIALSLAVMGVTLLELVWQESLSADVGKKSVVVQQLADAAGEIVIGWFHDPETAPPHVARALEKRFVSIDGAPTFFDRNGQSQFAGTAERPDVVLDASDPVHDGLLNDPDLGLFRSVAESGTVRLLKLYAPMKPGLLCTVEVTVETNHPTPFPTPFRQSIGMQLEALELPVLRRGVQAGGSLDLLSDDRSISGVHWASVAAGGDVVIRRIEDIPAFNPAASVTGQSYGESSALEDRWMHLWAGGPIREVEPTPGSMGILPPNVHSRQIPIPGMSFEEWSYEQLKQTAMRFGSYYVPGSDGLLYEDGNMQAGRGLSPRQVFSSQQVGDQRGLIFVDTLDRTAPRTDNMGTIEINAGYFEGVAVVHGHVRLNLSGTGNRLKVQSPRENGGGRMAVDLSGIHLNGVLYTAGNIVVESSVKVYGAVIAEGNIRAPDGQGRLEVWHDDDMSWSLFRGVPVVYRAPGTWMVRY